MKHSRLFRLTGLIAILTLCPSAVRRAAADDSSSGAKPSEKIDAQIDTLANRGIEFLRTRGQADNGAFSGGSGAAVTALVIRAILEHRPEALQTDPVLAEAMDFLRSNFQPDGGIYETGSKHRNYETSIAVIALVAANEDGKYDSQLTRAESFLKGLQWDESEDITPADPKYGGAGYGSHSRPDMSNTAFFVEALHELGNDGDDEAIQKALTFISRTQNLAGQGNDTAFADKIGDGGFYYTPAAGGQSKAGAGDGGGLRSYGSMTYAGLKSMIYAGLTRDDPRVQAVMDYVQHHYTLENNPGMNAQGLYYYFHTFAKALRAAGVEVVDEADGTTHDWRGELVTKLAETQQQDGSWVNQESGRWMEGDRNLVTAYCLLALAEARSEPARSESDQ